MSAPARRACANCGTFNALSARHCVGCGQRLPRGESLAPLWGVDPAARSGQPGDDGVIDLTPGADFSSQATAPLSYQPHQPHQRPVDPWSASGGRMSQPGQTGQMGRMGPVYMGATVTTATPRRPESTRRPRKVGCLLGFFAFLMIGAVAGVFVWAVAKPIVSDRVRNELDHGIATQVAAIDAPVLRRAGDLRLTEAALNADIQSYAGMYDPVKDVRVDLVPDEARISFDLYGTTSTFRGGLEIDEGRLVVVEPELSGAASQLIAAGEIAEIFESQLAALLARSNLQPTAVRIGDGEMTITTRQTLSR